MTTNATRDHYSGILVPDDRITVWDAECAGLTNTAGGHVGQPVETAGRSSALGLRSLRRERTGTHGQITVRTQSDGLPNEAAADASQVGTFLWMQNGTIYGWNPVNVWTGTSTLQWTDGSGIVADAISPHIVVSSENTALCVYSSKFSSGPYVNTRWLRVHRKAVGASDWSAVIVAVEGLDMTTDPCPCLMPLPDGRLMLYYARAWTDGSSTGTCIASVYSDDDGLTWSNTPNNVTVDLTSSGTATVTKIRAAVAPSGESLMIVCREFASASVVKSRASQFASVDFGTSYQLVGNTTDSTGQGVAFAEVIASRVGFVMAYATDEDTDARVARFGSAYTAIHSADTVTVISSGISGFSSKVITGAGLALVLADVGDYYLFGFDGTTSTTYTSADAITWSSAETRGHWWVGDATNHRPNVITGAWHEGVALIAHQQRAASGTTYNKSVSVSTCGGYANSVSPPFSTGGLSADRFGWFRCYGPFDTLDAAGFTAPGTLPSTADIVVPGAFRIANAGAVTSFGYTRTFGGYGGAWGEWSAYTSATTGTNALKPAFIDCHVYDGTTHTYGFRVTMAAGLVYLFEKTGSATYTQLASAAISPPTNTLGNIVPVVVRWAIDGDSVKAWWRYDTDASTHTWVLLGSGTGLTDLAATFTTSVLTVGARVGGGDSVLIYGVRFTGQTSPSQGRAAYVVNGTMEAFSGRKFSTRGTYITGNAVVSALGGPTVTGDTWTIDTAYDYDLDRTLQTGPRMGWRSLNTTDEVQLAYRWSSNGDGAALTDTLGIALCSTNVGRAVVEFYDADTSTWTGTTTLDLTVGPLRWTRSGDVVTPSTSSHAGKATPLMREAEWDGAQFTELTNTRLIRAGTGGKWTNATTSTPRVYLVAPTGFGATGTAGRIIARDVVMLISLRGASYSGVRITLQETDAGIQYPTAEGYWRIGSVLIGQVAIFADETAWGRTLSVEPRREVVAFDDGTVVSRILGPPARRVETSWTDGIDTTQASEDSDDPAYHTLDASGQPLGLTSTTPWQMEGLYTRLQNRNRDDLVYLARIEAFSGTSQVVNRRHNIVYGRIEADSIRLETVQGEESVDEVIRIGKLTIAELT